MRKCRTLVRKSVHTDYKTGEVDERVEHIEVIPIKAEPFFLTYSKQICAFYNMSIFNSTVKVLWKLLEYMEWDKGIVKVPADTKDEIISACNISKASFYRAIDELTEAGIITKGRGVYHVNEDYFWKGSERERRDLIAAKANLAIIPQYPD